MRTKVYRPEKLISFLKATKTPFTMICTSLTTTIKWDNEIFTYSAQSNLKLPELGFIKKVYDHCINIDKIPKVKKNEIDYISHGKIKNGKYSRDIYEIDLNAAYWNFAKNQNFINDEIYEKGNQQRKIVRLIALGNLAKVKNIFSFDGNEFKMERIERSELTENIFFKVSQMTDYLMKKLMLLAGNDYLFYWVDAIFVQGENTFNRLCDYLTNDEGVPFKFIKIDQIIKSNGSVKVYSFDEKTQNQKKREFIFQTPKKIDLSKFDIKNEAKIKVQLQDGSAI